MRLDSGASIYESKARLDSPYSYLQYHWWPIALTARLFSLASSIWYRIRKEGMAIKIKTKAGKIVHTISRALLLITLEEKRVLLRYRIIITKTIDKIILAKKST